MKKGLLFLFQVALWSGCLVTVPSSASNDECDISQFFPCGNYRGSDPDSFSFVNSRLAVVNIKGNQARLLYTGMTDVREQHKGKNLIKMGKLYRCMKSPDLEYRCVVLLNPSGGDVLDPQTKLSSLQEDSAGTVPSTDTHSDCTHIRP